MGDAKMVASRQVAPAKHHVAEGERIAWRPPLPILDETERACLRGGPRRIEPPGMRLPRGDPFGPCRRRQVAAGAGIARALRPMRCGPGTQDVGPAAETRIHQPADPQLIQHAGIGGEMAGLDAHRAVPNEVQPLQVL